MAGFNLLAVDGAEGLSLHWDGTLRPLPFGAGTHVISSDYDLDDPAMPERRAFPSEPEEADLRSFLTSHEGPRPVCKHGPAFGTVSSTLLFLRAEDRRLLHAEGPPCTTPFADLSALLR